jgi:hypothetical protein
MLRPIAGLMLRCGLTWREVADVMKVVYVEVASRQYGKHGRPTNASRVAIMTGLSRREVKRVRDRLEGSEPLSLEQINHASRLLSGWHYDPDFTDSRGRPRLLAVGGERGFEALLRRYAPDIPPTAMLKELKRVGALAVTPKGKLRAKSRYYMPAPLDPQSILRAGSVVHDISRTIERNLTRGEKASRFEGRASNLHVKRVSAKAFRAYVERRGMALLEDADAWLAEHEAEGNQKTVRLGVGVYWIADD